LYWRAHRDSTGHGTAQRDKRLIQIGETPMAGERKGEILARSAIRARYLLTVRV
jgi:hypothetical protein